MIRHGQTVVEALEELGYRLTPQRLMILDAIQHSEGHVTAEEICDRVRATYPHINISTVYRTMELLKELGLVVETDLGGGRVSYHGADKARHHHLICTGCGAAQELEHDLLTPLEEALERRYQFQANVSHFAIFGRCAQCRRKEGGG